MLNVSGAQLSLRTKSMDDRDSEYYSTIKF